MKASEIRLGNIVLKSLRSGLGRKSESAISMMDIVNIFNNEGSFNYEPIPLTEDWLIKFGFIKEDLFPSKSHSNYFSQWIEDYKYSFAYAEFRGDWGFYNSFTDAPKEEENGIYYPVSFGIKYVHQIQNLYWCLAGKELKTT